VPVLRIYPLIKMFVLGFMLGVYVLFLITIAAAYYAGGWVVVMVDKYQEGTAEIILLSSLLPLATYVTLREATTAYKEIKKQRRHPIYLS